MSELQLTREEQIRLECINQAILSEPRALAEGILAKAQKFETYVKTGKVTV